MFSVDTAGDNRAVVSLIGIQQNAQISMLNLKKTWGHACGSPYWLGLLFLSTSHPNLPP